MNLLPSFLGLLQTNDQIAEAVSTGTSLAVEFANYGGLTGTFAVMFLFLIQFWTNFVPSYGLAIIFTAITVRLALIPLTIMQVRGMRMMQMLQPVQKEIVRYYPTKADQNAKMMELYQEYKINPLAGCMPMLIQFPILIGVYRALYDPSFAGHNFLGVQLLFPVSLTSAQTMVQGPNIADTIDVTIAALGLHSQIWHLPEGIPLIGGGFWYTPALALVVLYAGSSVLLQRVMKAVNKPDPEFEAEFKVEMKATDDGRPAPPDFAQQMQRQMGLMNVMILIIAFLFSAGALIYFICQNLIMSLEYTLLSRRAGGQEFDAKAMKAFIRKPPPPLPQRGVPPAAAKQDGKREARKNDEPVSGKDGSVTDNGKPQGEAADQDVTAGAGPPTQRPRKRRRKR